MTWQTNAHSPYSLPDCLPTLNPEAPKILMGRKNILGKSTKDIDKAKA
jgi:hypothetical protein